ncbi:TonB-dependent vitamin B12 receptor [Luteimonas pelagia]
MPKTVPNVSPRPLALALAAMALPAAAAAQDAATDLDRVQVTATRTASTVDEALAAVEVIDRADIERSQATSLPDLLRGRAGISLVNQGGAGKLTTLFMRGAESDHVLVLVDGVRMGSATSGLVAFQDIPLEMIERVEIVRGPRSSLYGSEAIGGVIQLFTRRGREGVRTRLSAGAGSHGQAFGSAGIDVGGDAGWFGADAAYRNDEGIDACRVARPSPFSGGCFIFLPEPDRDGYRNRSLSLRAGTEGDGYAFDVRALHADGRNAYDGDFQNLSKATQQVFGANGRWQASDAVSVRAVVGRNTDASDNYLDKDGAFLDMGYFDTDRDSAGVQADVAIAAGQALTLGVDWIRDRVDSSNAFDATARRTHAGYVQYQGEFGAHAVQAAVRRDDDSQFGGRTTGNLAWGLGFGDGWRVTAGAGTAFKAPTFNELYYPFFGNPALRPERARSVEAGLRRDGAVLDWRIDAYDTDVDDLIAYDAALGLPNNIERARMRGAELGVAADLAGWQVDASLSVLDTEQREGANAGNELPRRARHSARLDLDRGFGAFTLGATVVAEGSRHDDVANTRRLASYATFDVRAEWALSPSWTLQGRVANLFDADYETTSFYRQPGREWLLTLRYAGR